MTPRFFFEIVVVPNLKEVENRPDDVQAVVNAILTLDALVGILFEHLCAAKHPEVAALKRDGDFRDQLAEQCPSYAAVRDTATSLKHGRLCRGTKARVVRLPDQLQTTANVLGLFEIGDEIGGHVAVLCLEGGIDAVRVDDAMAATCQRLLPLLHSLPGGKPP